MLIRSNLKTYGLGPQKAFESLCNQIFEEWVKSEYGDKVCYFSTIRGEGGDGGVESYAGLTDGAFVGLQAKWFDRLEGQQINQIRQSIHSALDSVVTRYKYVTLRPVRRRCDEAGAQTTRHF
jgi:hypothetical protein